MPPITPVQKSRYVILSVIGIFIVLLVTTINFWMPMLVAAQYGVVHKTPASASHTVSTTTSQGLQNTNANNGSGTEYKFGTVELTVPWSDATTVKSNDSFVLALTNTAHSSIFITTFSVFSYEEYSQVINATPSDPVRYAQKQELSTGHQYERFENSNGIRGYQSAVSATSSMAVFFTQNGAGYQMGLGNLTSGEIATLLQSLKDVQ